MVKELRVGRRIRAREVRVIGEDGVQLGIMKTYEALRIAAEEGLDLVEVSPNASPPVCRIMDYGKYKYQQKKKHRDSRKHQASVQVKEIKMRPRIDEHDYQFKKRHIEGFLNSGHKVRAIVKFRGREITYKEFGFALLQKLANDIRDLGVIEQAARMEGRIMVMLLAPKTAEKTRA